MKIRLLRDDEIDCRVQSISKNRAGKVGAVLLLYKDARVDMRILDELFGVFGWQRTHEVINDNLFCNILIKNPDTGEWIKKQDVGVESNTEKEKGEASDSFKRAGFNIGIGRELYTSPFIYVELEETEYFTDSHGAKETYKCYPGIKFYVSHILYNDRREISDLVIRDKFGNTRYDMSRSKPQEKKAQPIQEQKKEVVQPKPKQVDNVQQIVSDDADSCPACGGAITEAEQGFSMKKYGRIMCRTCQKKG